MRRLDERVINQAIQGDTMDDMTQKNEAGNTSIVQQASSENRPVRRRAQGMFEDMERMFDQLQEMVPWRGGRWGMPPWVGELENRVMRMPSVDIIDRDTEVIVRAAVPGMKKDDLELSLTENTISLAGKISREEKEEKADYVRSEIYRGDFSRTLSLPADVDAERAKASFRDGVLEVVVPKKQPVQRKSIPIE
jgi:HSP20 family protein